MLSCGSFPFSLFVVVIYVVVVDVVVVGGGDAGGGDGGVNACGGLGIADVFAS